MASRPLVCDVVIFLGMANLAEVLSADGKAKAQPAQSSEFQIGAWQILTFEGIFFSLNMVSNEIGE